MKHNRFALFAVLWMVTTASAGPILLASLRQQAGLGGEQPVTDQRIQFTIQIAPTPGLLPVGVGEGVFWEDGARGSIDFTPANDSAFAEFARFATNGIDDHLTFLARLPDAGAGGGGNSESVLFGRDPSLGEAPDLAGYELDVIRLTVNEVRFDRFEQDPGVFIDVQYDISYEFFGRPMPAPGTLILLAVGATVVLRCCGASNGCATG